MIGAHTPYINCEISRDDGIDFQTQGNENVFRPQHSSLFATHFLHSLPCLHNNELHLRTPSYLLNSLEYSALVNESICSSSCRSLSFHYVGLHEPDKPIVLSWIKDQRGTKIPPRQAFVLARIDDSNQEIIIDLTDSVVISSKVNDGHGYPLMTIDEEVKANMLPFTYAPFVGSIKKRGLTLKEVVCQTATVGWFGEKRTKRVVTLRCVLLLGCYSEFVHEVYRGNYSHC